MSQKPEIILSQAPHIRFGQDVNTVMWFVVLALMPATIFSVITFGLNALLVIIVSIIAAVLGELAVRYLLKRPVTVMNGSAVLTGLLLAMNVPPDVPLWLPAAGSFFAIIIVKELFGGLGYNIFNPALAGRAFLMASWPALMTTKWHQFDGGAVFSKSFAKLAGTGSSAGIDVISAATPLSALKEAPNTIASYNLNPEHVYSLFFHQDVFKELAIGQIGGVIGETSAILLLVGALFLLFTKIITWHIPVAYFGSFSVVILAYYLLTGFAHPYQALLFHLLSGGLFLGALYMATDMVTSPITKKGMIIFGIGCGLIASIIRLKGGYPEGVSYSILLMNAVVPLIDKFTRPKIFGKKAGA